MEPVVSAGDLSQLRAFVVVADLLSFSRAAERLGVTGSALSQTVRAFEERLGARLLNRTTRSVSLTPAGAALHRRARPAMDELGQALASARGAHERVSGMVRVHSFRVASERIVRPMLDAFGRAHPNVTVDLTVDDEVVDLVARGFDLGIRIGEVIERDMVAVRLGPDLRQFAVASPAYLAEHGIPAHPRDLGGHRCIRWRWPGQERPHDWRFVEQGRWFKVAVDGPLVVNSRDTCVRAALDGLGVAFMSELDVAEHHAEGALVPLLERWSEPFAGFFACYPERRLLAPAVRAFVDALTSHVRAGVTSR